jgi:hypothetical protein
MIHFPFMIVMQDQEDALLGTLDALDTAISYEFEDGCIPELHRKLVEAYAQVEAHWPLVAMTIILHLTMLHMAERMARSGPTKLSRMFYMEDFFGWLKRGETLINLSL